MRTRHHAEIAAGILLMGVAVLHGLLGEAGRWPQRASVLSPVEKPLPSPGSRARDHLEWCRGHVAIIHDVHWASACAIVAEEQRGTAGAAPPDDSAECTLPDARAFSLNLARAKAEQECLDEVMAGAGR